eukprot:2762597-Alexandrium_andersonii.AAC.1
MAEASADAAPAEQRDAAAGDAERGGGAAAAVSAGGAAARRLGVLPDPERVVPDILLCQRCGEEAAAPFIMCARCGRGCGQDPEIPRD